VAAKGWVGDKLGVFTSGDKTKSVRWLIRWESEVDAQEFLGLYREFLTASGRGGDLHDRDISQAGGQAVSFVQKGKDIYVKITG
jgi:hypothetical protein